MNRSRLVRAFLGGALAIVPVLIYAYAGGPPPARTGAPGERTCIDANCHAGTRIENSDDLVLVTGGDMTYVPGGPAQRWSVRSSDGSARAYGFQLSTRAASDGSQAGELRNVDASTQVVCEDSRLRGASGCVPAALLQFLEHNEPRLRGDFAFEWTPPKTDVGEVLVYVALNASVSGQRNARIHLRRFSVRPARMHFPADVSDAASFRPAISAGAWITIAGSGLAASTREWRPDDIREGVLPTSLDGVEVLVNGRRAVVAYVSPGQVNALAPREDEQTGIVPVEVRVNGRIAASTTARKEQVSPSLFTVERAGRRFAAASVTGDDVAVLYGTGFGDGALRVTLDGVEAPVAFSGLVQPGLQQVNVRLPGNSAGPFKVVAESSGVSTQADVWLSLQN